MLVGSDQRHSITLDTLPEQEQDLTRRLLSNAGGVSDGDAFRYVTAMAVRAEHMENELMQLRFAFAAKNTGEIMSINVGCDRCLKPLQQSCITRTAVGNAPSRDVRPPLTVLQSV